MHNTSSEILSPEVLKWSASNPSELPPPTGSGRWTAERVLSIRHWTPTLISFRTTRPGGFRFTPGHYARLGLEAGEGSVVWRPYSIASAVNATHLEFLLVLVPGGEFSSRMATLRTGDPILVERASFGFLTLDQLAPGAALWLLASGTGIGAFAAILRDPVSWRSYEQVIVAHSVRRSAELVYRDEIAEAARQAGAVAGFRYIPVVTREPGATALAERLPALLSAGVLESHVATPLCVETSRVMACGNPEMTAALRSLLRARGFVPTRRGVRGQMAFENYW